MQVWRKLRVGFISDAQACVDGAKVTTRKVQLYKDSDGDCNPGSKTNSAISVEVTIENADESMLSQIFNGEIGNEVEIRFTAGDMLKEIDEKWAQVESAAIARNE